MTSALGKSAAICMHLPRPRQTKKAVSREGRNFILSHPGLSSIDLDGRFFDFVH